MLTASEQPFNLDSRLRRDTLWVGDWELSRVLLMNDSRYAWLILVPRVKDVHEVIELSTAQQQQLWSEVTRASELLKAHKPTHKLNIGALGNVVAQLHVHVLLRHVDDPAWPGPTWGHSPAKPYTNETETLTLWRAKLGLAGA